MNKVITGLLALAWFAAAFALPASAQEMVNYKPGAIKAALAQGKAVLIDYKAVW